MSKSPGDSPGAERVSRRALFKGAGLAATSAALLGPLDALAREAAGEVRTLGPGPVTFRLTLNGRQREVTAEPRQTLLEALRLPPLGLTGAKPACERSQCGACTVWLDGRTVYACSVLAVETEGREVTTVEGLGTPEAPHPMQLAFVEADALQCGFCTPGMVMSCAEAYRTLGARVTPPDLRAATEGNLCRCGTYPHVLDAALRAARKGG
jgi:xanthine dehydrogenase YagT iron-sulfur-binding subunit